MMHEVPWPRKGDVLFASGSDSRNRACINFVHENARQDLYARGYRTAAEQLTKTVMGEGRYHDVLIYPIVFLWRHYIELRLKGVLSGARQLLDYTPRKEHGHKLLPLWRKLRPILEQLEPGGEREPLDAVEDILSQLDAVDIGSIAFRYPRRVTDEPSLPDDLQYINIRNLTEVMQRAGNFLEAVDAMVWTYLEYKIEMEYDYRL